MKKISFIIMLFSGFLSAQNSETQKKEITYFLDQWHKAAA